MNSRHMNAKLEPKIIWSEEHVPSSEEHSLLHRYVNKKHLIFFSHGIFNMVIKDSTFLV